ncbi:MAG: preprotein translocase subunit SecE [Clostridia bacterium]|nr:preprotein translocase subunit SecE [Clostridia bacterium]
MAEEKMNLQANETAEVEVEATAAEAKSAKAEKRKGEKKENFFVRLGKTIKKLCRDLVSEMKKVVWLSKSETKKSSVLVIVTVIAIAAAIGVVDTAFSTVINFIAGLIG